MPRVTRPQLPPSIDRLFERFWVDFPEAPSPPSGLRLAIATLVALVGSIGADALLVAIGKAVFPSTRHFSHLHPADYAKLTIIGVLIACVAWPIVTRISSASRWLFVRLAIVVTLVLFLPDFYLLLRHESARGVLVLMCMHVAIALVTYNALVRIAPAAASETQERPRPPARARTDA